MPLLAKKQQRYSTLADSNNDTGGEAQTACERILAENNSGGAGSGAATGWDLPIIEQSTNWIKQNKSWLPWVLAAGFGVLYLKKDRK